MYKVCPLEVRVPQLNDGMMMRFLINTKLLFIFIIFFSNKIFAGVGDTYVCKEKEFNKAGYKHEFILYWNQDTFEKKDKVVKGSVDTSSTHSLTINNPNYFVSLYPYRDGHIIKTFDGNDLVNIYIEKKYSYTSVYNCSKF